MTKKKTPDLQQAGTMSAEFVRLASELVQSDPSAYRKLLRELKSAAKSARRSGPSALIRKMRTK